MKELLNIESNVSTLQGDVTSVLLQPRTHTIYSLSPHSCTRLLFPLFTSPLSFFLPSPQGDIILVSEEFNDGWMRGLRLGDLEVKRGCCEILIFAIVIFEDKSSSDKGLHHFVFTSL